MANRVTDAEVKEIIETGLTTTPFINIANSIINETLLDEEYSESYLTSIELMLSAHLVALRERQLSSEKLGDSTNTYSGGFGEGLSFTQYGQNVLVMDHSGVLQALGKPRATIDVYTIS